MQSKQKTICYLLLQLTFLNWAEKSRKKKSIDKLAPPKGKGNVLNKILEGKGKDNYKLGENICNLYLRGKTQKIKKVKIRSPFKNCAKYYTAPRD